MALTEGTEWIDRGANVLLFGPPGVGKSHLVSALGHALIDASRRVLFIITSQLPIKHWHAWVSDATIADAILDRVMQ